MRAGRKASRPTARLRPLSAIVAASLIASLTLRSGVSAGGPPAGENAPSTAVMVQMILIAGGCCDASGQPLDAAELYDPLMGVFLSTGDMTDTRIGHTATTLASDRTAGLPARFQVLIAGGSDSLAAAVSSADLYDETTGQFSATGSMTVARTAHTATLLPNGLVLVCGGRDAGGDALSSADLYDPLTGAFSATGEMTTSRAFHTATLLASGPRSGQVLIAGGADGNDEVVATADCTTHPAASSLRRAR